MLAAIKLLVSRRHDVNPHNRTNRTPPSFLDNPPPLFKRAEILHMALIYWEVVDYMLERGWVAPSREGEMPES